MINGASKVLEPDDLLDSLRKGDLRAYEIIFKQYYGALCLFAAKLTSNDFVAEEIVQDVLYKLWEKHDNFQSHENIKAFLYISTKNAAFTYLSKEKRKNKYAEDFSHSAEEFDDPVINSIIYTEVIREITHELDQLPEQCGKIMKLLYEENLSPQEIADQLNLSVSTVYNQKKRGLMLLKTRLSGRSFDVLMAVIFINHFH